MATTAINPNHTFTTNGNATVPELNKFNVEHKADGIYIRPQGASVVNGWVRIPISCPTVLAKAVPRIVGCSVAVATSDAKIDTFYLSVGSATPLKKDGLNYETQFGRLEILSFNGNDLPQNVRPGNGPCISLELKFKASGGLVRISWAAVDLLDN